MNKCMYAYAKPLEFSTDPRPCIISFIDESIFKGKRKIVNLNEIVDVYTIFGLPINKKVYANRYKIYPFYNNNIKELICPFYHTLLPKQGAFTGYKIVYCKNKDGEGSLGLCTLLIEDALNRDLREIKTSAGFSQCCTDKAKVLSIVTLDDNQTSVSIGGSYYSPIKIFYEVGKTVIDITGDGIYFFMTPQEAICYSIYGY